MYKLYRIDYTRIDIITDLQHYEFLAKNDEVAKLQADDFVNNATDGKGKPIFHKSYNLFCLGYLVK